VLEEIGVAFVEQPRGAGALARGRRRCRGRARAHPPRPGPQALRHRAVQLHPDRAQPARNVEIGGNSLVLAPVYGPPFVRDLDGGRRYATMEDFRTS
jgi:trimethylamine--corrinoid protein Co-methyltransferase